MDQRRPAQVKLKLNVLLEVAAERGEVQIVTQVKLSAGHQHVDFALDRRRKQREHALWRERGEREREEKTQRHDSHSGWIENEQHEINKRMCRIENGHEDGHYRSCSSETTGLKRSQRLSSGRPGSSPSLSPHE